MLVYNPRPSERQQADHEDQQGNQRQGMDAAEEVNYLQRNWNHKQEDHKTNGEFLGLGIVHFLHSLGTCYDGSPSQCQQQNLSQNQNMSHSQGDNVCCERTESKTRMAI